MKSKFCIVIIILIFMGKHVIGQNYPITRDTLNSFPDSVIIEGELIDYSIGLTCGTICGSGALKVKVIKPSQVYKPAYIFVVVPCLSNVPNELKRKIRWELSKLQFNDDRCFWAEGPVNKFDTNGIPFYVLENK